MIYVIVIAALAIAGLACCSAKNVTTDSNKTKKDSVSIDNVIVTPEKMVEYFNFSEAGGMTCISDDKGNIYTNSGEITLEKGENGGRISVRYEGIKTDTISVGDDVFLHVSKMVKAYKLKENAGSYTDSDIFVTDVSPWGCTATLKDGTFISGAKILGFEVKDKKRMRKCAEYSEGVYAICDYLHSVAGH